LEIHRAIVTPCIFWPHETEEACVPCWPKLQHLYLRFYSIAATAEAAECNYRKFPSEKMAESLYLAAARAAAHMPVLEKMRLEMVDLRGFPKQKLCFDWDWEKEQANWSFAPMR
jgi:hypothetical protein